MKKIGLFGYVYDIVNFLDIVSVHKYLMIKNNVVQIRIFTDDMKDIHKYLMKKWYSKKCLYLLKNLVGSAVLSSLVCTTTLSHKNEDECSSCLLYIVLFSIFFATRIGLYFVYYKYINLNKENACKYDSVYRAGNYLI